MTGKHVVRIALEKGWEVVAAVRDPTKLQDLATMAGADRLKVNYNIPVLYIHSNLVHTTY